LHLGKKFTNDLIDKKDDVHVTFLSWTSMQYILLA